MKHQYQNPIIPGFSPDPSICRCGEDYYIATSSFEWFPGIPVYHSKDLLNWSLKTYIVTNPEDVNLRYIESAKGLWAPCLRYDDVEEQFTLCYNVMHSMNARFFDVDNYMMTAKHIDGPWSKPIFLHSAGFDGSMFRDDDGRKWFLSMEWETRDGYHKPGVICMVEYDDKNECIIGYPKRIFSGATTRGCIEGPHIYKRNGYYYLMCAEGGTGYGHAVTMARSKDIWGPYEPDPKGAVLTSCEEFDEMDNDESRKLNRFNPNVVLQKAGHGSIVETPQGEVYMAYHVGRPLLPNLCCTLGRETCIQKMKWTEDGWLCKAEGEDAFATVEITPPSLPIGEPIPKSKRYDLNDNCLPIDFSTPRIASSLFTKVADNKINVKGNESLSSCHEVSYLGRKLTSLHASFEARLSFTPDVYQQYAGVCIYYDQMDYLLLRKTWSDEDNAVVLDVLKVENGERKEFPNSKILAPVGDITMKVAVQGMETQMYWRMDNTAFTPIGDPVPTHHYSDEYCKAGEFTGTTVGMYAVDALLHKKTAQFDNIVYNVQEENKQV